MVDGSRHGRLRVEKAVLRLFSGGGLDAVNEKQVALAQLLVNGTLVTEAGVRTCMLSKANKLVVERGLDGMRLPL